MRMPEPAAPGTIGPMEPRRIHVTGQPTVRPAPGPCPRFAARAGAPALAVALALAMPLGGCGGGGGGDGDAGGTGVDRPPSADERAAGLQMLAPAPRARSLDGPQPLQVRLLDDGGTTSAVEFELDGRLLARDEAAPWEASFDASRLVDGQHTLRLRRLGADGRAAPWFATVVEVASGRAVEAGGRLEPDWAGPFAQATAMDQAPDGRWFVAEQGGTVRVLGPDGTLRPVPFMRLADVDDEGERGLIGLALHPDFARNGWVYLHHTARVAGGSRNRVIRLTAAGDVADGSAPLTVLELPLLGERTNHNGGAIRFATDGRLLIGVGENAVPARAQDPDSPFGKLLRLRDDGGVPDDNPRAGAGTGLGRLVWASGLRNPFSFAVDPASGAVHVNDVGRQAWEEINLVRAGANFGWPAAEGFDGLLPGHDAPRFAYGHGPASPPGSGPGGFLVGGSIAGGAFQPAGSGFPAAFDGHYYFADFVAGFVARLDPRTGQASSVAQPRHEPVDLRFGRDGALYVLGRERLARVQAAP